jgi:hypothetical protein
MSDLDKGRLECEDVWLMQCYPGVQPILQARELDTYRNQLAFPPRTP